MTNTQATTKTSHYFRALTALVALAMVASMLVVMQAARPAHASTTFTVNVKGDAADTNPGDGTCSILGSFCSLRAAIQEANTTPGPDTINFDVNTAGDGLATISPESPLPTITDTVTIDGYTQPGASPNTLAKGTNAVLKVELDGINAGISDGLKITAGGGGSVIKGLVINDFNGDGISVEEDSDFDRIEGNFIGTDTSGTLTKKNPGHGVIVFGASDTTVGGNSPAARNLISGNGDSGVLILANSSGTKVLGNLIGTKKGGKSALGNGSDGVSIFDGINSSISANTVAFNDLKGVRINASSGPNPNTANGNRIVGNSIFSNGLLGIDLGGGTQNAQDATANDPGDADVGPNGLQNKPAITSARTVSGKSTIKGKLSSRPKKNFTLQFFSNPSGNEGKTFIGQKAVRTGDSGTVTFTFTPTTAVSVGRTITATATASAVSNTSEFSASKGVVAG